MKYTALLAQIEAAIGHAGEVSHYTVDALLADAANAIRDLAACKTCDGTGYAVNCGPTDRERGDLWACGSCAGTGETE